MKIVINNCYGGFCISKKFAKEINEPYVFAEHLRTDPRLIAAIESGRNVGGECSELVVVTIPDDVQWHIAEYDGLEHVAEAHRVWYGG